MATRADESLGRIVDDLRRGTGRYTGQFMDMLGLPRELHLAAADVMAMVIERMPLRFLSGGDSRGFLGWLQDEMRGELHYRLALMCECVATEARKTVVPGHAFGDNGLAALARMRG